MTRLLRKFWRNFTDETQRLDALPLAPGLDPYIPPACAYLLTREERGHVDWLIRHFVQ